MLLKIKKYQTASSFIQKALAENPNDLEAIKLSGQIDRRLANIDEAIESSALLAVFEPQNQANKRISPPSTSNLSSRNMLFGSTRI